MNWALCLFTVGNTFSWAKVTAAVCLWLKKKSLLFLAECTCVCLHSTVILIFLNDLYGFTCTSQVRVFFPYALFSKSMWWPTLASPWRLKFAWLIQQVHCADGAQRQGEVQSRILAPWLVESTEQSASFCSRTLSPVMCVHGACTTLGVIPCSWHMPPRFSSQGICNDIKVPVFSYKT